MLLARINGDSGRISEDQVPIEMQTVKSCLYFVCALRLCRRLSLKVMSGENWRHSSIQAVTWLLLDPFRQDYRTGENSRP
jgi:hypothetical protein